MLLSYRPNNYVVPHTSTCIIHTIGKISYGAVISVTSPIFSSINFTSRMLNLSERFQVKIRITNDDGFIYNESETTSTLVCDDNDTLNMYVRV